jgi:DNA repair protein RecO (recombination protein O)
MNQRYRYYQSQAIVLKHTPIGESDIIVTFYTRDFGKLPAVARRARRPNTKLSGDMELLNHLDLSVSRGRSLDHVNESIIINTFKNIRTDLHLIGCAMYVVELIDIFGEDRSANKPLFDDFIKVLTQINLGEINDVFISWFQFKVLHHSGFIPEFMVCIECSTQLKQSNHLFYIQLGGIICQNCVIENNDYSPVEISIENMKLLRFFQRTVRQKKDLEETDLDNWANNEVRGFLGNYITYVAEKDLNSSKFIKTISSIE